MKIKEWEEKYPYKKTKIKIKNTSAVRWNLDGRQQLTLIPEKQINSIFKFIEFVLWRVSAEPHGGKDKSSFSLSGHNVVTCLLMFLES